MDDYPSFGDISIYLSLKFNKCPSRNTIKKMIKEIITGYTIMKLHVILSFCKSKKKDFCTHELFTHWFLNKFIPYLKRIRKKYQYQGKCVIIMDGFAGHGKSFETLENVFDIFYIKILLIPPNSSDQVQPLDLFEFNIQKNKTAKFIFNQHYSLQSNTILAIIEGLSTIKSPYNVTTAYQMAGIYRIMCDRQLDPNNVIISVP